MKLANPLPGVIVAKGEAHAPGQFRVTSTLADHIASGRAKGTDFSNGKCGAPVFAMEAGLIYRRYIQDTPGLIGDGALVVRIRHANGGDTGYAHLASFAPGIKVGVTVRRGQQIGTLGTSGADACHLHAHYQDAGGTHRECFDLLGQNQEESLTTVTLTLFPAPRQCSIAPGATVAGYRPTQAEPERKQTWPEGSSMPADADAFIEQLPLVVPHGSFYRITAGVYAGLFVPIDQVSLAPATAAPDPCAALQAELALANATIAKLQVLDDSAIGAPPTP
jgi:murein DD-endopeptidase MepM/ murein hydrolase activator NlpD